MDNNSVEVDITKPENNVNLDDIFEIFKGPAVHSNKIYLGVVGNNVRLTFCEEIPETKIVIFRTAVMMNIDGLTNLSNLINQVVTMHYNNIQKQLKEQQLKQQQASQMMDDEMERDRD